jgi:type IV pilus assembly protein PilE
MSTKHACSYASDLPGSRGFTLIELLITVAVVAILSAIAYPSYINSVRKSHRTDAKTALTRAAQSMERYMTEKGSYTGASIGSGTTATISSTSENGYYTLSFAAGSPAATTFTIQAAPTGSQAGDNCGTFTIDEAGTRGVTGGTVSSSDCW